jgi:small subunit ribosomal protein S2
MKGMGTVPSAVFIIDPAQEQIAVSEARRLHVPVIAITDTNCDPDQIDYVIPGNDDAIRSIRLITSAISDACIYGLARRREYEANREARDGQRADKGPDAQVYYRGDRGGRQNENAG